MALLEIKNVSKRFGGLKAVTDVNMSVETGEIAFIVGPNGAGKTTLFNLITSVHQADAGQIVFDGHDITHSSPNTAAKLGIGRTFQIVKPLRNLTVLENTMLGAFLRTSSPAAAEREAAKVLQFLGVFHRAGGNLERLQAEGDDKQPDGQHQRHGLDEFRLGLALFFLHGRFFGFHGSSCVLRHVPPASFSFVSASAAWRMRVFRFSAPREKRGPSASPA